MSNLKDEINDIVKNSGFDLGKLDFDLLDINEKINALYNAINYIFEFIKLELIPEHKLFVSDEKDSEAINHIFLKIYCQIKSLSKLNEITDFQCISFIARSIFELYTDMVLISNELIENCIQKYYSFQKIQLFKISKNQSFSGYIDDVLTSNNNPARDYYENNKNKIDDVIIKHWGKDKNNKPFWPDHWSGIDLYSRINKSKIIENIFDELKRLYFKIVTYCNIYIHSDPSGTLYRAEEFYYIYVYNLYSHIIEMIIGVLNLYGSYFSINQTIHCFHSRMEDIEFANTYFLTKSVINKLSKNYS